MAVSCDPRKDQLDRRKHGIALAAAAAFDWDAAVIWPDRRFHYTALRECALGFLGNRLYFQVFVDEGHASRRALSRRRASKGEVKR